MILTYWITTIITTSISTAVSQFPSFSFLHLFQKRIFPDKWHRFVTGRMSFVPPSQQCQSTEGNSKHLYSALSWETHVLKRSGMAHVNEGSHSFTCHPHVYPQVEWTIRAFTPQTHSITALWPVLIFYPAEGRRLSWPECLVQTEVVYPPTDGHSSQY